MKNKDKEIEKLKKEIQKRDEKLLSKDSIIAEKTKTIREFKANAEKKVKERMEEKEMEW